MPGKDQRSVIAKGLDSVFINELLHEALEGIYANEKALFPFGIQTIDDIRLWYGIY